MLRDKLFLCGTKNGCNHGVCGACNVLVDGKAMRACLLLAITLQEREITTIEGLSENGELSLLQKAFASHQAFQCGFCTSGMLISATALLDHDSTPSISKIRHELGGNICRCTGYVQIIDAVKSVCEGKTDCT